MSMNGETVTFEEMEELLEEGEDETESLPDYSAIKAEGEDIPEHLRGKSMKEVIEHMKRADELLKEQINKNKGEPQVTREIIREVPSQAQPVSTGPTLEEIKELYERDPMAFMQQYTADMQSTMERNIAARMQPLIASAVGAHEQAARIRYKDDFELLGSEIQAQIAALPDKSVLANPQAWDTIVTFVKGQNLDKILDAKLAKKLAEINGGSESREEAQREQRAGAPTGVSGARGSAAPKNNYGLDADELAMAEKLDMTPKEYAKWRMR